MQRANFDVSIKQAAISIFGKRRNKIRCKSRETDLHPLAEREDFEPITLTAYATISFFSKISNR